MKAASRGVFWVDESPLKGPAEGVTSHITIHNGASTWYQLAIMPGSKQGGRQVELENGSALPPLVMIMGPDQTVEMKAVVLPPGATLEITADRDTATAMGTLTIEVLTTLFPVHIPLPNWLGCADMGSYVANLPTAADAGLAAAWRELKDALKDPSNIAAVSPYLAKHNVIGAVKALIKVYNSDARAFAALSHVLKELGIAVKPTDLSSSLSDLSALIGGVSSAKILGHAIGAPHDDNTVVECISRTVTPHPAPTNLSTSTVFVMDCSGSMSSSTPDGVQKLQAAKQSAEHCLSVIRFDKEQLGADHLVGLVAFSDTVCAAQDLTPDLGQVEAALNDLRPMSSTNFGEPLDRAVGWLEAARGGAHTGRNNIIFLSDGMTNTGPVSRDEFLVNRADDFANPLRLYQRVRDAGISIHTIGFGNPSRWTNDDGCDEEVLRKLAELPGTGGRYLYAAEASKLDEVYIRSFHEATGDVVFESTGTVGQGERKAAGTIDIVPEQGPAHSVASRALMKTMSFIVTPAYAEEADRGQVLVTLGWSLGKLSLELRDPSGQLVNASYPGAHLKTDDAQPICVAIDAPKAGKWNATVIGDEVPGGESRYHLIASARVPPQPVSGGGGGAAGGGSEDQLLTAVLLATCIVLALSVAVLVRRRAGATMATRALRPGPGSQPHRGGPRR